MRVLLTLALGVLIGAALTFRSAPALHGPTGQSPVLVASGPLQDANPTDVVTIVIANSPWCGADAGCTGLAGWSTLVSEPRLRAALTLAFTFNPDVRPSAGIAVQRQTQITAASLPPDVGGTSSVTGNRIQINEAILDENPQVLAAIVAHELFHAGTHLSFQDSQAGAAACLGDEIDAFAMQAETFSRVPPHGAPTSLSATMAELVTLWRAQELQAVVTLSPSYQAECFDGHTLPSPVAPGPVALTPTPRPAAPAAPSTAPPAPTKLPSATATPVRTSAPSPVALRPGESRTMPAGWIWVCSGDVSVRRPDGTVLRLYDDDPTTGLLLVLMPDGRGLTVIAPYGASCSAVTMPALTNAMSNTAIAMLKSGCTGGCQRVRMVAVDAAGSITADQWVP